MSEQERPQGSADVPGREAAAVVEDDSAAQWEGYSLDTLAALDP